MKALRLPLLLIFGILVFDQWTKIYIKTHFELQESVRLIPGLIELFFIENNGMAWGIELGGSTGKLFLSIFRIVAVSLIGYLLFDLVRKKKNRWLVISLSLIFAGALGNILDSMFYGIIFSESHVFQLAEAFPPEGGYAPFLQGKVVDMLHFTVHWPDWVPYLGGDPIFRPIFNFADTAITIGVSILVVLSIRKKI